MVVVRNFEVMFENYHNYNYTANTTIDVYCNKNRSPWPRGLRRVLAVVLFAGITGSNPTGGMVISLL
jgi:hypothetical protein